jgi:hypothetical protein
MERSELHIRDNGSDLKIYVPRNERAQHLCFYDTLPKGLLEWLMTEPSTQICEKLSDKALNVMQKVLQAPKQCLSEILDREGIVTVEMLEDYDLELPFGTAPVTLNEVDSDSDTLVLETPASSISNPPVGDVDEVAFQYPSARQAYWSPALQPINPLVATPPRAGPVPYASPSPGPSYIEQVADPQYRNLLDKVIAAARRTTIPSRGAFHMSALNTSLADGSFRLGFVSQRERDKMIGAAGELFVSSPNSVVKEARLTSEHRCSRFFLT